MLAGGACNPVTSTYPDSTPATTIAGAVTPPGTVDSLWVSQVGAWLGFSPQFPDVSDLTQVDLLQVVFICVSADGAFARPIV